MRKIAVIFGLLFLPSFCAAQCSTSASAAGVISGVGTVECSIAAQVIGLENVYCTKANSGELTHGTPLWGANDDVAALPTRCIYTGQDATPSPGNTVTATDSSDLASKLAAAACGDTIVLTAGTVYVGEFTLSKTCDAGHWITIRTSELTNPSFPAQGVRATPCLAGISNDSVNGRDLPGYPDYSCPSYPTKLVATIKQGPGASDAAIQFGQNASHYRLIGIEVEKDPTHNADSLIFMQPDGLTLGANNIIFDRMLIHGVPWTPAAGTIDETGNGIQAKNTQWVSLINSWVYDTYCNSSCVDSHDFGGGTGIYQDGPFKLYNNLMATGGESWMFGGGGQGPGTPNTADVEIRSNLSMKPLNWMVPIGSCINYRDPVTKNLGEFKNMTLALLEGNVYR